MKIRGGLDGTKSARNGLHNLLLKIASNDETALEQLHDLVGNDLAETIRRESYELDEYSIDSIYSQLLSRIWERSVTYKGNTNLSAWAWMRKIASNLARDHIRRNSAIGKKELPLDYDQPDYPDGLSIEPYKDKEPGPEDRAYSAEGWDEFLASLTKEELRLLEMKAAGMNQKAIAKKMSKSEARISQHVKDLKNRADRYFGNQEDIVNIRVVSLIFVDQIKGEILIKIERAIWTNNMSEGRSMPGFLKDSILVCVVMRMRFHSQPRRSESILWREDIFFSLFFCYLLLFHLTSLFFEL